MNLRAGHAVANRRHGSLAQIYRVKPPHPRNLAGFTYLESCCSDGTPFGYYSDAYFPYLYHFDVGFVYFDAANDGTDGAYLYDFGSRAWWYTNPALYPYLYDFGLNAWLYYLPNPNDKTHYTTNPRYFNWLP